MRFSFCRRACSTILAILLAGIVAPSLHAQSAGPNVNMVSEQVDEWRSIFAATE